MLQQMRAVWEAVNNGWNQWVLNYTQSRQLDLLKNLGVQSPSWVDMLRLLGALAGVAALAWLAWMARAQRSSRDEWLRLMDRTRARLRRRSEEHTSELQSQSNLVCRLLLEKKKTHRPSTVRAASRRTH